MWGKYMSSIQGIQHNSNLSSESGAANILNTRVSLGQQMYKYFSGCQCVAVLFICQWSPAPSKADWKFKHCNISQQRTRLSVFFIIENIKWQRSFWNNYVLIKFCHMDAQIGWSAFWGCHIIRETVNSLVMFVNCAWVWIHTYRKTHTNMYAHK